MLVTLGRRWLVDVGFGAPWATAPLDVDARGEQRCDGQPYRVREDGDALVAEELGGHAHPNAYRFTLDPVPPATFAERCRAFSTDPESGFVRRAPVQQVFADGWASLTRTHLRGVRGPARRSTGPSTARTSGARCWDGCSG